MHARYVFARIPVSLQLFRSDYHWIGLMSNFVPINFTLNSTLIYECRCAEMCQGWHGALWSCGLKRDLREIWGKELEALLTRLMTSTATGIDRRLF